METFRDGTSAVVLDDRKPVFLLTLFGATTEALVHHIAVIFRAAADEARRTNTPVVFIYDATDAERPSPKARALMVELHEAQPTFEGLIFVYAVIPNALIRGAMTAMQWLSRKPMPTQAVPSVEEALRRGLADLERAGGRRPTSFEREYVRPPRPR